MPSKIIKNLFAAAGTISGTMPAGQSASPDFISYAKFLYPFALSVAAILAVAMIVIAGMEMVTFSWNPVRLQSAKEKIWAALGGLLLAALSFLILRTINPDLITLRLSPPKVTITSQTFLPLTVGIQEMPLTPEAEQQREAIISSLPQDTAGGGTVKCITYRNGQVAGVATFGGKSQSELMTQCQQQCKSNPAIGLAAECVGNGGSFFAPPTSSGESGAKPTSPAEEQPLCIRVGLNVICQRGLACPSPTPTGYSCQFRQDLQACTCLPSQPTTTKPPAQTKTCTIKQGTKIIAEGQVPECVYCRAPLGNTATCR